MEGLKKGILVKNNVAVGALGDKYFSTCPLGTVLSYAGTTVPHGYLLANGASYKVSDYPDLYAVIGNTYGGDTENFNVPDYRETVLVGIGENTTDTIANHDVYELGEFKDDQLQGHWHYVGNSNGTITASLGAGEKGGNINATLSSSDYRYAVDRALNAITDGTNGEPRLGTTTHGKQKGVTYIIKAFHTNEGVDSGISDDVINYINNSNSYSTEETLTGGKWIDGKPIYRKVCVFKISEEVNAYDLSDLNFDECWITNGFVKQTDGTVNYPMNFFRNNADDLNGAWIRLRLKQLVVQVANLNWFNNNAYVVIEYTKTTDA